MVCWSAGGGTGLGWMPAAVECGPPDMEVWSRPTCGSRGGPGRAACCPAPARHISRALGYHPCPSWRHGASCCIRGQKGSGVREAGGGGCFNPKTMDDWTAAFIFLPVGFSQLAHRGGRDVHSEGPGRSSARRFGPQQRASRLRLQHPLAAPHPATCFAPTWRTRGWPRGARPGGAAGAATVTRPRQKLR